MVSEETGICFDFEPGELKVDETVEPVVGATGNFGQVDNPGAVGADYNPVSQTF